MGFLKFKESNQGGDLHWHRADRDGAPFRGAMPPLLKEEEFEDLSQKVLDSKVAIFDASDPTHRQHGRTYQEVLDGVVIGWFRLVCDRKYKWGKRKGKLTMFVYVEWVETYVQLPKSAMQNLQTVVPVEDEVSYAKTTGSSKRQPRALRKGTEIKQ